MVNPQGVLLNVSSLPLLAVSVVATNGSFTHARVLESSTQVTAVMGMCRSRGCASGGVGLVIDSLE